MVARRLGVPGAVLAFACAMLPGRAVRAQDGWDDWVRPASPPPPSGRRPDRQPPPEPVPSHAEPVVEAPPPPSSPQAGDAIDADAAGEGVEAAAQLGEGAWNEAIEAAGSFGARVSGWMEGPAEFQVLLGLLILAGVGLWLFGARLARAMFIVLGFVLGAALGFVLMPVFGPDVIERIPSPYIGFAGGSILGMIAAAIIFRFAIALSSALVFAAAGVLATSLYIDRYGLPDTPGFAQVAQAAPEDSVATPRARLEQGVLEVPLRFDMRLPSLGGSADARDRGEHADAAGEDGEARTTLAAQTRSAIASGGAEAGAVWRSVAPKERFVLAGAGVMSAVLGLLIGLCMPKRSAIFVTALAGSGVWLLGLALAAGTAQLTLPSVLGEDPAARLILWGVVALVGMGGQVIVTKRAVAPTPAAAAA